MSEHRAAGGVARPPKHPHRVGGHHGEERCRYRAAGSRNEQRPLQRHRAPGHTGCGDRRGNAGNAAAATRRAPHPTLLASAEPPTRRPRGLRPMGTGSESLRAGRSRRPAGVVEAESRRDAECPLLGVTSWYRSPVKPRSVAYITGGRAELLRDPDVGGLAELFDSP